MTALRQTAIRELEKLPEDKISFILQIMQGVNGVYYDAQPERKEAFAKLEKLRRKGTVMDYESELASYREEKFGSITSKLSIGCSTASTACGMQGYKYGK